ncbi:MAG: GMC oxidoreductase [Cellvibrionales bacterium]|nr:GMC family oxidoreductase [Porticoccaceae bacterium]|tara:strand:+ start:6527 stop:8107 length:1581 start_codon:yes stop_codon:yes gene_type:complete
MVGGSNGAVSKPAYDSIIVGSGASGSIVAAALAAAGQSVLILEAGPRRELAQLTSSQLFARGLKWSGAPVEEEGNHTIGHGFNAGFGAGGSALHHYGVWPRLHSNDFDVLSKHGKNLDWPIGYEDLRPYYDAVQSDVGLSGDAEAEIWRPQGAPYPLPPLPVFRQGKVIDRGFRAMGLSTAPIPMAINSIPNNGAPGCTYDGWCDAGCPIGALKNPLVTHLARAQKLGVEICYGAQVSRVVMSSDAQRVAKGVEYFDSHGVKQTVNAGTVVIAAFAVQSVRILLNSQYADGVAVGDRGAKLGRYLMTHPGCTVFGLFNDPTDPHLGPTGGQLICHDHYDDKTAIKDSFGSYQWLIANAVKPNGLLGYANSRPDIFGAELKPFMQRAAKHIGNMLYVGEDSSSAENRILLSDRRDKFGLPIARTIHNAGPEQDAQLAFAMDEGKQIFRAAGATEVWTGPRAPIHIMGGAVMGSDPELSVTNDLGKVHHTDNLYVVGPSTFPTSGAVNPTFTVSALAYRTAEHLASKN